MLWGIVYVMPMHERRFLQTLEQLSGYEGCAYAAMKQCLTKPKHKRDPIRVQRPLFPGYVFLKMIPEVYRWAFHINGFLYTLKNNEKFCLVEDEVVQDLMNRESQGEFNQITDVELIRPLLVRGAKVVIQHSMLAGRIGVVRKFVGRNKLRIDVDNCSFILPLVKHGEIMYRMFLSTDVECGNKQESRSEVRVSAL